MKGRINIRLAAALFLVCVPTFAEQIYKCEINGKLRFQGKPCPTKTQKIACPDKTGRIQYQSEPCPESQHSYGSHRTYGSPSSSRSYGGPTNTPGTDVKVRGYTREDGTYVPPHTRGRPGSKKE